MAIKKVVEIDVKDNFDKSAKNVKQFAKEVDVANDRLADTKKAQEDVGNTLDGVTGGMVSKFKILTSSIGNVINSMGLLKTAIIGTGIGALLVAIVAIKQAFTSSEEGQNRWAKIMQYIGTIVGNVTDILTDLGNMLIWVFTHPREALVQFVDLLKKNVINRLTGLLELIPNIGKAISKLFSGDFKGAAKTATDAFGKVALGVESVTDSINKAKKATQDFIKEQERELAIAEKIANSRAKADKLDRSLITQRAEADRKIADLRDKAVQKDVYNVQQRIKFLLEAQKIENEITDKEIKAAKLRRDAKIEENKLSNSNKEALKEEEELKAKVIELETQRLQAQKTLNKAIQAARREAAADAKAIQDEKKAKQKEIDDKEKELALKHAQELAEIDKMLNDSKTAHLTDYLNRLQEFYDQMYNADLTEQEREIQNSNDKYFELTNNAEQYITDEVERKQVLKDLEIAQKNELNDINIKYAKIKKDQDDKIAEDEKRRNKELLDKKYQMTYASLGALSDLTNSFTAKNEKDARRQFKINKALALSQAAIQTFQAVTGALTAGGNPVKLATGMQFIEAGIAAAVGGANIAKIAATQFGGFPNSNDNTRPTEQSGTTTQQAPSFNIVGNGTIGQLPQLQQAPVQAYVVSGEVTSQQALDRNRLRNATF